MSNYNLTVSPASVSVSLSRTGGQGTKGDSVTNAYIDANDDFHVVISNAANEEVSDINLGGANLIAELNGYIANVQSIYDSFDDRYLGAKAVNPTLDNDNDALLVGAIFFNTSTNEIGFWNGTAWEFPTQEASTSASNAQASANASAASATQAETAETNSLASANNAATSETNAATSETNANTSAQSAAASVVASASDAANSLASANNSAASAGAAATSAANAATSEANAATSETNATDAESNANASEIAAGVYANNSQASAANAAVSETNAAVSEANALTYSNNASSSATASSNSATSASASQASATASQTAAATSATNAATSETNAATSETNAATSATASEASKVNAASYAQSALASLSAVNNVFDSFDDRYLGSKQSDPTTDNDGDTLVAGTLYWNSSAAELRFYNGATWEAPSAAAATSATNAATSETNAATSETNAAASAASALASQSAASTSETNAATSETNAAASEASVVASASAASTSETNAAASEVAAANSETAAAASQASASTSATNAAASQAAASTSATAAAASASSVAASEAAATSAATSAASSYDQFDDRYLGSKTSDPTVDNDGDAILTGAIYFDSTNSVVKVYNGTDWQNASSSIEGIKTDFVYTAILNQTLFVGNDNNTNTLVIDKAGLVSVFMNGIRLVQGTDYTVNVGANSITLSSGAAAGDTIEIQVFGNFTGQSGAEVAITGGAISGLSSLGVDGTTTFGGNTSYGDNVKATFGDSADLQVYHDGSRSLISDQGFGNLVIRAGDFTVQNPEGTETFIQATRNGSVDLYYDQGTYTTPKLQTTSSGINVTGRIDADDTIAVEGSNPRIQVQDTDGTNQFSFLQQQGSDAVLRSRDDTADGGIILAGYGGGSTTNRMYIAPSGDISFYEDTGTTAKFLWDASTERLGIGTTSPATKLDVAGDASITNSGHFLVGKTSRDSTNTVGAELKDTGEVIATVNSGAASYLNRKTSHGDIVQFRKDNITVGSIGSTSGGLYVDFGDWTITESGGSLYFATGGTNKMKLDASGNLDVVGSVNSNATIT